MVKAWTYKNYLIICILLSDVTVIREVLANTKRWELKTSKNCQSHQIEM